MTDDKKGESLDHYELKSGDVVVVDRGYNQPKSLVPFADRGGEIVLRYNPYGMNLYHRNEEMAKVDWAKELKDLNGQPGNFQVYLCHENKRIEGIVHACPLPPEKAAEARRRTIEKAKKKGRTPKQETLFLSGWVLVFTTLPEAVLDTETIGALYRVRWQVELVIKRLKSLLDFKKLRAPKDSDLSELYLYGKLLYAAVLEKIAQRRFCLIPVGMIPERKLTPWRLWHMLAEEIKSSFTTSLPAISGYEKDCLKAMCERPRKRRLQTLPKRVFQLLGHCRELEVCSY